MAAAVVWRVGDIGAGPEQFHGLWHETPDGPVAVHRVAVDEASGTVPATHPGPLDGSHGFRAHTLRLTFDLTGTSPDGYDLMVRVKATTGPAPQLSVRVNGVEGLVLVRPRRDAVPGLHWPTTIGGWADLVVPLEPGLLVAGANTIDLKTVALDIADDDELRAPHPAFGDVFGSMLVHAGMELRERSVKPEPHVALAPTPLYVQGPEGLVEEVDVLLHGPAPATALHVQIGKWTQTLQVPAVPFGQRRLRLQVPEVDGPRKAELQWAHGVTREEFRPCRKWTLHLIPHVHLDVGFTDYQGKVAELQARNLDRVRDLLGADPSYRYTIDGGWVVDQYLRTRSESARSWLLEAMRTGSMQVNAYWFLFLTGLASLDELYHALRFADSLERDHGVPLSTANLTDVPSYSWAIPSTLAAVGIDTFLGVANHFRAENDRTEELHALSPFWWTGPDGGRVLTFLARHYAQLRYMAADPPTIVGCAEGFSRYTSLYERDDYLPSDLPIVGINSDNEDLAAGEADIVARWGRRYAWPRLRFSTVADYFGAVESLRDRLPVARGDGGSYWEDGVASHAATVVEYRQAQALLPVAEGLQALVGSRSSSTTAARTLLDRAWDQLLIGCEHTWTSDHSVDRPHSETTVDQLDWKTTQVHEAWRAAKDETRRGLSQLAELVTTDGPAVLVFNGLSWPRSGPVEMELPTGLVPVGKNGQALPSLLLAREAGLDRLRVDPGVIPAWGYRSLSLARATPSSQSPLQSVPADGEYECGRYLVRLRAGRIVSLTHLPTGRELLDVRPYALAELLVVRGGGTAHGLGLGAEATSLYNVDWHLPPPSLEVTTLRMTWSVQRHSLGVTLVGIGDGPGISRCAVRVTFGIDDDRVRFSVHVDKAPVRDKEAVYVAFPFNAATPSFRYTRQQGWVDPELDHAPGACNEWFTTQDAVVVSDGTGAVCWASADAPLWVAGEPVAGRWPSSFEPSTGTVLSWLGHNYWHTNFPAIQSGPWRFEYAFEPMDSIDLARAARIGRETRVPLLAQEVNRLDKARDLRGVLPSAAGLLEFESPEDVHVEVVAARRHDGMLVRLRDVSGSSSHVTVTCPSGMVAVPAGPLERVAGGHVPSPQVRVDVAPWSVEHVVVMRPEAGVVQV